MFYKENKESGIVQWIFIFSKFTFGVIKVVFPQWSDFVLTPDVPDSEGHALYGGHSLHIETYGRDGGHNLIQLYLVQYCCLSCKWIGLAL